MHDLIDNADRVSRWMPIAVVQAHLRFETSLEPEVLIEIVSKKSLEEQWSS